MLSTPHLQVAVDVGSHEHYAAIGLSDGQVIDEFPVTHNSTGFNDFFRRIQCAEQRHKLPVVVAMEGYNGWARPLDSQVMLRGYPLFNINNLKLARFKEIFPTPAKTDEIDVHKMLQLFQLQQHLTVAKGVLQEVAPVCEENQSLKRLTRRRRQVVDEKVRLQNRIQPDLMAVCPGLLEISGSVANLWFLRFLTCRDDLRKLHKLHPGTLLKIRGTGKYYADKIQQWQGIALFSDALDDVGSMILEDAHRLLALINTIKQLEEKIEQLIPQSSYASHIESMPGFGVVCSGELAGEIGNAARFAKESSFSMYLGMAPLDNKSGTYKGSKPPRHVNRRARKAMYTAACRHMACVPESRAYYDKKRAEGKTHNQAIRSLGRQLCRAIWSMLKQDRDYLTPEQMSKN